MGSSPLRSLPFLLALLLVCLQERAHAQGGYRNEEFTQIGLELPVPRDYKAVPVEPTERWVSLRWVDEKTAARRAKDEDRPLSSIFAPQLMVVWIDWVPDPVSTGDGPEGEPPPPPPVNTFERYLDRYFREGKGPAYYMSAPEVHDDRDGNTVREYVLDPARNAKPGWATVFRTGRRSLVLFGRAEREDWEDQVKIWQRMAKRAELVAPEAADLSKWERFYERRPEYVDPEYRLKVREALVRGWEADDTDNYIFVYSTRDEPLMRFLKTKLEAIRDEYEELFPPEEPVRNVSTVRICRDRNEYLQYGGSPWSGGYWNSAAQELVFYDYKADQERLGDGLEDSRIVLMHEAFHQYIYYSAGELPPHSWFNEGTGDFFSGAKFRGSKVVGYDPNPWRKSFIQRILLEEPERLIPFEDILSFEQAQFYKPNHRSICYAQAWSMIYFLRTSRVVEKHSQWSEILDIYFERLKVEYRSRLTELGPDPTKVDRSARGAAGVEARKAAVETAFDGVDLDALEAAWRDFLADL